ncbi:MAG: HlyC/CorC family transporter [Ruminococcaceae bacterium]|nr:HlyC/CorC family transporter [Oscillospiraceae bacterium]
MNTPLYIIIMACLVLMSAYFSATETAFSSLNKARLKVMGEKSKKARLALKLSENYDKLISSILIGNNIVNISLSSIGTVFFIYHFDDAGATISTVVITIIVLIFGEVCPKSIAKDMPEAFAVFSAPIIRVFAWVLSPINFLFSLLKKGLSKMLKVKDSEKTSQEELIMMVEEVTEEGTLNSEESTLVQNAIEFSDLKAEDILTHRIDIEAFPVDATKEEIAEAFSQSKYSRLLVYEENIDNIVGVVHQKDFYTGTGVTQKDIRDVMTAPIFVLPSKKIDELLRLLQKNKSHVAVVLDEYGGTYGLVTMEDILEELVGDIWDEHDEVTENYRSVGENVYRVNCAMSVDDFCTQFEVEIETETISLSGWVTEQLAKIPDVGDSFDYLNLSLRVIATESHRVTEVEIVVNEILEENEEVNV